MDLPPTPFFDLDLAKRIKAERKKRRITQLDLSIATGLSRWVIYEFERGVFRMGDNRDAIVAWLDHGQKPAKKTEVSTPVTSSALTPDDVIRLLMRASTHDDVLSILRLAHGSGMQLAQLCT